MLSENRSDQPSSANPFMKTNKHIRLLIYSWLGPKITLLTLAKLSKSERQLIASSNILRLAGCRDLSLRIPSNSDIMTMTTKHKLKTRCNKLVFTQRTTVIDELKSEIASEEAVSFLSKYINKCSITVSSSKEGTMPRFLRFLMALKNEQKDYLTKGLITLNIRSRQMNEILQVLAHFADGSNIKLAQITIKPPLSD